MRKVFTVLKAINAMRRSYAAESEWQGQHSERPFDKRPALLEDDYDINRARYLKMKKMLAREGKL